ncbi:MAG: hypothetical protein LC772_03990, partial [Chloroflexi bacterium]|nr:hypothetical protein [Chloroflexota bacterium]
LTLLLLVMGNRLARRFCPPAVLSRAELITIYIMTNVAVVISGMGMVQFLLTTLGGVHHGVTDSNHWKDFSASVPRWLLPPDQVFDGFYKGNAPVPWHAWMVPCFAWGIFLFAMLWCMLCINTLVRKQWSDQERLTFPLVYLPLEMTDPAGSFFRSRAMWYGFLVPVFLESMNSLNYLYPSVPKVQIRAFDLAPFFVGRPWNQIGYFPITFYPLTIGLGFLLSLDVSFSCWSFYLLTKAENVISAAMGFHDPGSGSALARIPVIGTAVLVGFCWVCGLSPLLAFAYIAVYLIFATAITRMRAEAGPPWNMGPDTNARDVVVHSIGTQSFGTKNLSVLAYFEWFSIEMRCVAMPGQLESMKMGEAAHLRQRLLTLVMVGAIIVGIAASFWACLLVWYHFGAGTAKVEPWRTSQGMQPFSIARSSIDNPRPADIFGMGGMAAGALVVLFFTFMRTRFLWWPFNPVGYALANTGTMYWLWMPFLIAWILKVIIIRYGGMGGYRRALPFFLGLALGDYFIASVWAIAGSVMGMQMYRCFPV